MTREFFERFLHAAQSEDDDDSAEQDTEHEAQDIPFVPTQPSNDGDNLQGDIPQAGLATVDGVNTALEHVIPQSTEQPTNQEPSIAPQLFAPYQAVPGSPQGSSWNSTNLQNPAANFGAGSTAVPNVPVSVAPVLFTIDLQEMAKSMGFIVVPAFP